MPAAHGAGWIALIRIDRLRSWCSRTGNDPASGSARSGYAAELARTAPDDPIRGLDLDIETGACRA
jgi:hypothetical protein